MLKHCDGGAGMREAGELKSKEMCVSVCVGMSI